jgi:hypothetical protein
MAQDEVMELASSITGDTGRQFPIVDPEIYQPLQGLRALTMFRNGMSGQGQREGLGETLEGPFKTIRNEWPWLDEIELTAPVVVGDTTASVKNSSFLRKDSLIEFPGGQQLDVKYHPGSLTSITIQAATSAVAKGQIGKNAGISKGEVTVRGKAMNLATDSHICASSKLTITNGITYEMDNRKMYGIKERARIDAQTAREFRRQKNSHLITSQFKDGTSDGKWRTNGLRQYGRTFNWFPCPRGVLTEDLVFEAGHNLTKYGNAEQLEFITSKRVAAKVARWPWANPSIVRVDNTRQRFGTPPANDMTTPVKTNSGSDLMIKVNTDFFFETRGWDTEGLLINWSVIKAIRAYPDWFDANAEDPGVDIYLKQWNCFLGWAVLIELGAVALFTNIQSVRMY